MKTFVQKYIDLCAEARNVIDKAGDIAFEQREDNYTETIIPDRWDGGLQEVIPLKIEDGVLYYLNSYSCDEIEKYRNNESKCKQININHLDGDSHMMLADLIQKQNNNVHT